MEKWSREGSWGLGRALPWLLRPRGLPRASITSSIGGCSSGWIRVGSQPWAEAGLLQGQGSGVGRWPLLPDRYPLPPYPDTGFQVAGVSPLFGCVLNAPHRKTPWLRFIERPLCAGKCSSPILSHLAQPAMKPGCGSLVWHMRAPGLRAVRQLAQGHTAWEGTASLLGSTPTLCGPWGTGPSSGRDWDVIRVSEGSLGSLPASGG